MIRSSRFRRSLRRPRCSCCVWWAVFGLAAVARASADPLDAAANVAAADGDLGSVEDRQDKPGAREGPTRGLYGLCGFFGLDHATRIGVMEKLGSLGERGNRLEE